MRYVSGQVILNVSFPVNESNDEMAKLAANYIVSPELTIGSEFTVMDCKGEKHSLIVNEILDTTLDDVVD